ncbi:MAG: hypothetical protein OSA99_12470 [Acidimicrobiales bacterium]|nr:hypothetical protein [Acidimicrobiales bacterium]
MTSTLDRTRAVLAPDLAAGETVLAAAQAQLDGGTMRLASRVAAGAAGGGIAGVVMQSGSADDLEAALANGLVLAVSGLRVILLDVTAVSARPKSVVATIDRSRITDTAAGEKRVMLVKLPTIALTIDGADDHVLRFEVPKTSRRDAEAVIAALHP